MNGKQLTAIVVTFLVLVGAWKISQEKAPQTEVERGLFFPNLLNQVNQIGTLVLKSDDATTSLERVGESWVIGNKDGFAAEPAQVKKLLLQLASLRTVEAKTSSPERYARLGVADIGSGSGGTQVSASAGSDTSAVINVIVGNTREQSARPQHYLRRDGEQQSWLAEGDLEVSADPIRWLDASIVDIDSERVKEVLITAANEPAIHITKNDTDDSFFALQNVPKGFEPKSKTIISSMGALLLDLRFNDVASRAIIEGLQPARKIELRTFNGLKISIDEFPDDQDTYVRFSFSADESEASATTNSAHVDHGEIEAVAETGSVDTRNAEDGETEQATETPAAEAARLNAHTKSWVYLLPKYKQRMIDRKFDSLIKAIEDED